MATNKEPIKYKVTGRKHTDKTKSKCGDYFSYQELADENILIMALSDGVGSRHHDDVASLTACNIFIDSVSENKTDDLALRLEKAIKAADKEVSNPHDISLKGMMCTFTGIIWNMNENIVIYDSIGDSRIYKYQSSGLTQISEDSKKAVLIRDRSGKLINQDGTFVIREGLTNALGYNNAVIKAMQEQFNTGEAIILCSDGMYSIFDFEKSISELISHLDLERSLEKFIRSNKDYFNDDASLLILRRSDHPVKYKEHFDKTIDEFIDYHQNSVISHLLADHIQTRLLSLIETQDGNGIIKCVDYIERFDMKLSEEFIENAIQTMKKRNFFVNEFYNMLIKQLRIIKW